MSEEMKNEAKSLQTNMFLQNLIKLIPVEIIALFAVIKGLIPETADPIAVWVVFGVMFLLVPFYVIFAMKVHKWDQVILMTFAFPIWTIAIGGMPAAGVAIAWLEPWMMSVALALFTLIPPMFYGHRIEPEKTVVFDKETNSLKPWREI